MQRIVQRIVLLLVLLFLSDSGYALPRFASRTGAKCQSCHVNPTGGMMRQAFGEQYGRETLPVPEWSKDFEVEDFSNLVTNFLGIGADFNTLFFSQQIPDTAGSNGNSNRNTFYQMQGDLYLNFRLAKHVNMFLKKGLYSGFEIFGLLNILPASGYLKIGKFLPDFGTKLDDHTAFIRTYTGFSPELGHPELTGAEAGFSPGPMSITGGVYNSTEGLGTSETNKKAYLGRIEGMFKLAEETHLGIGVNVFSRSSSAGVRTNMYGGFGSFSQGNLTIFGEADIVQTTLAGQNVSSLITYVETDYVVTPGVDLKLAYDFYDPDIDLKTGASSRYSIGVEFFPMSGVELRPLYRIKRESPVDLRNNEFDLLIHFYL
jgi:hypothetical protein